MEACLPFLALAADRLIGDPRLGIHPVVLIGNLIAALDKILRRPEHSRLRQTLAGGVLAALVLSITYGLSALLHQLLLLLPPVLYLIGCAAALSFTISPRSLAEAGQEIYRYLIAGNMTHARYKVGWIVGRDTSDLDTGEVTRATVETIAENIVDGIIAPLFYFAVGGMPLAFLYRAVNTLDSMVGYKNDKYRHFGMISARVDDIFNFIPARITAFLILVASFLLGLSAGGAWQSMRRDAAKHPSPNSGWPEAGVAGALGIRLGGTNYYGGIASHRAHMGSALNPLGPQHITQTIAIMYAVTILFCAVLTLLLWQVPNFLH